MADIVKIVSKCGMESGTIYLVTGNDTLSATNVNIATTRNDHGDKRLLTDCRKDGN